MNMGGRFGLVSSSKCYLWCSRRRDSNPHASGAFGYPSLYLLSYGGVFCI